MGCFSKKILYVDNESLEGLLENSDKIIKKCLDSGLWHKTPESVNKVLFFTSDYDKSENENMLELPSSEKEQLPKQDLL